MEALTTSVVAVVLAAMAAGGFVTGVNGFGFAVVGTALLAAVVDPATAVVLMILPMLAANVSLVGELEAGGLRRCVERFWPYVGAALVGTVVGTLLLPVVPARPLKLLLGGFVLGYAAYTQPWLPVPGKTTIAERCFREGSTAKAGLGLLSGLVFGATNVGVQVVAYLKHLDLSRSTFVGVMAFVFLGVSLVRVGVAAGTGLYADRGVLFLSIASVVPGLVGVAVGRRARTRIPERLQRAGLYALLGVIGVRLATAGVGF